MSDAERQRFLRRLRFPKELEQAFQADYYRQVRPTLAAASGLLVCISVAQSAAAILQRTPLSVILGTHGLILLCSLVTLGLTCWRPFFRYWQAYCVVTLVTLPLAWQSTIAKMAGEPFFADPAARMALFVAIVCATMLILGVMLRLQFVWAILYQGILVGTAFGVGAAQLPVPAGRLVGQFAVLVLPGLLMLLLASYGYERLHRSAFLASHLLELERKRAEDLLRNVLPESIAERLKLGADAIADEHSEAAVLFADIADFTPWSALRPARESLDFLNGIFSRFDRLVEEHGAEKIKTVGDCYMVVAGAPTPRADPLEAAARLALAMQEEARQMDQEQEGPLRFRMGLHAGPLVAGVIGEKRFLYDVWGDTVNTASRLESHGVPGTIQVSAEVARKLQGRFLLRHRGEIEIKGKGPMVTYLLEGERPVASLPPIA